MPPRKGNELASWEVDAHSPQPRGETRTRRSYCSKELVLRPAQDVDTVHDILLHGVRRFGANHAFGKRDVLEVFDNDAPDSSSRNRHSSTPSSDSGSSFGSFRSPTRTTTSDDLPVPSSGSAKRRYKLSTYNWISYDEALDAVTGLGSGLRRVGAGRHIEGTFFGLYGHTSRNWMLVAQACAFNAVPICTLYDTLPAETLANHLAEARVSCLYVNADLLPNIVEALEMGATPLQRAMAMDQSTVPRMPLRFVVYDGAPDSNCLQLLAANGVKYYSVDELRDIGKKFPLEARRANREDVFCCMWTSGGNDKQKGVLLTHGNICSAVASVCLLTNDVFEGEALYLAFLPQAHVFEFVVEMVLIFSGVPIAYSSPVTLTDAGVKGCASDLMEARPSIMVAVPQVWEIMKKGIQRKVDESGALRKSVFNLAVKAKSAAMERSLPGVQGVTDALVFNAVKKMTGGRLRTLMNGGGSVSKSTVQFMSAALVQMIQGYGLTEGTAQACIQHPSWRNFSAVGGPVPGVEIKLVDRRDLGYYAAQNEGEVYIRGPCVFKGYLNRPELDAASFTSDGWFKTGDIGKWNKDGTLTVIDRAKSHVLVAEGYITVERLESIYKSSGLLLNGCVLAHPTHRHPAIIAVAHPEALPAFCRKHDIEGPIEELCLHHEVERLVLRELISMGKKEGLKNRELPEALVLVCDEWSPESGLLTAAHKLKRTVIETHYAERLARVYTVSSTSTAPVSSGLLAVPEFKSRMSRALPDESPTIGAATLSPTPSDLDLTLVSGEAASLESPRSPVPVRRPSLTPSYVASLPPLPSPKTSICTLAAVPEDMATLRPPLTALPDSSPTMGCGPIIEDPLPVPSPPPSATGHGMGPSHHASLDFLSYPPDMTRMDSYSISSRVARSRSVDQASNEPSRWPRTDNLYSELQRQRAQSIPTPQSSLPSQRSSPRPRTPGMYGSPSSQASSPASSTLPTPSSPEFASRALRTAQPMQRSSRPSTTRTRSSSSTLAGSPIIPSPPVTAYMSPTGQGITSIPNLTPSIPNLTPIPSTIPNLTPKTSPSIPNLTPALRKQSLPSVPSVPVVGPMPRRPSLASSTSSLTGARRPSVASSASTSPKASLAHLPELSITPPRRTSARKQLSLEGLTPRRSRKNSAENAGLGLKMTASRTSVTSSKAEDDESATAKARREVDARRLAYWMDELNRNPLPSSRMPLL